MFRLFRLLKLVRYSPVLQTLGRVLADEYRVLLGALLVILVLLLFASTAMYMLERLDSRCGVVMLLGVGMIALPVAIIATGFSQESSRH